MVTVVIACWREEKEGLPAVGKFSSMFGVLTAPTCPESHGTKRQ